MLYVTCSPGGKLKVHLEQLERPTFILFIYYSFCLFLSPAKNIFIQNWVISRRQTRRILVCFCYILRQRREVLCNKWQLLDKTLPRRDKNPGSPAELQRLWIFRDGPLPIFCFVALTNCFLHFIDRVPNWKRQQASASECDLQFTVPPCIIGFWKWHLIWFMYSFFKLIYSSVWPCVSLTITWRY